MGDIYGKVEKTRLVDNDFTDGDLFPYLKPLICMDQITLEFGEVANAWKPCMNPCRI